MEIYFCDGSQSRVYKKLGIGITHKDCKWYIEVNDFEWEDQLYEIKAIRETIKLAKKRGHSSIKIFNDDKHLVNTINNLLGNKKVRSKGLQRRKQFVELIQLIKKEKVVISTPNTSLEKKQIKSCHELSRSYLVK